jgi:hypothetical protein
MMVDPGLSAKVFRLEDKVNRIEGILDGRPGEKGLKQEFTDFFATYKSREEDKMKFDDRMEKMVKDVRERKMFWLTVVSVVCGFLLAVVAIMTYEKEVKHSSLFSNSGVYSAQENRGVYDSKAE